MAKKKIDVEPSVVTEAEMVCVVAHEQPGKTEEFIEAAPEPVEVRGAFVYLGPTVPNSRLVGNRAYTGTLTEVREYLADQLASFPGAINLIVSASDMASAYHRVRQPGTALYEAYRELANSIRNR